MLRRALGSLAILCFAAWAAPAGYAQVRGNVLTTTTRAAERIEVILESAEGQVVARTVTDNMGAFEFRNVMNGRYDVLVRLEGYEEARHRVELGEDDIDAGLLAPTDSGLEGDQPPAVPISSSMTTLTNVNIVLREKVVDAPPTPEEILAADLRRRFPKRALDEYDRALADFARGDMPAATTRLLEVINLAPDFHYAHNDLGSIHLKNKRYREAEAEFNIARQLAPQSAQALINLGALYLQEAEAATNVESFVVGRILDEALDVLEPAVALEPRNANAQYLLGTAYFKSTFDEDAERHLSLALEIDPRMPAARLMMANLHMRQLRWESALVLLDSYIADYPTAADLPQVQEVRLKVVENIDAARR